jgi:amino acid adenylation domain-containing protein
MYKETPVMEDNVAQPPLGEVLRGLFADILNLPDVDVDEDFFELGGNSLLATKLAGRIRATLGLEISIPTLFETRTVAELLDRLPGAGKARPALAQMPRPEVLPLSFAQRRLWFLNQWEGVGAAYHIPLTLKISGSVQCDALEAAFKDVIDRHESLRTVFPEVGGQPRQHVLDPEQTQWRLPVRQIADQYVHKVAVEVAQRRFDLTRELPLRAELLLGNEGESALVLVLHHIAGDGWSLRPLSRDLATAYRDRCEGKQPEWAPLAVQYADYALWQRDLLGDENDPASLLAGQLAYWREQLADLPARIELPTDRPRPPVVSHHGATTDLTLPPSLHRKLLDLVQETGATLFVILHAGLAALLTRLGAGTDIPIGSPVAGRTDHALDDLVGFFVNTLVLRTDTSGDPSFAELIARVRRNFLAAYAHQDMPFERLVETLNPQRSAAYHPLFQVTLALQNTPSAEFALSGLSVQSDFLVTNTSRTDVFFNLTERYDSEGVPLGVVGEVEYSTDLFNQATVDTLVARWVRMLTALADAPSQSIGQVELLDPVERDLLLREWNDAECQVSTATLPDLFEAQVRRSPDQTALVHENEELTYRELNARANRLAHYLISKGVRPAQPVGVLLRRSVELIVALLGVAKAGGVYLPIDPDYPVRRIALMLDDARPSILISIAAEADHLREEGSYTVVTDREAHAFPDHDVTDDERIEPLSPHHPAYIIYTSGSTGNPKGVVLPHSGLADLKAEQVASLEVGSGSRVLQLVSPSFDTSLWDIFSALLTGGTLVLPPAGPLLGLELVDFVSKQDLTHVTVPPAVLGSIPANSLPAECTLTVSGDICTPQLAADWSVGRRMFNGYGPTEVTVGATMFRCRPEPGRDTVPIGRPFRNKRVYVLDDRFQLVPPGVPGELYVSGAGIALGYLNRPQLTAERFIPDPFVDNGQRMYRTGDLGRWNNEGQLEFLGRVDTQVKIRGFRIEPGEVESVLATHDRVRQVTVLARKVSPEVNDLVAYVVPAHDEIDATELRSFLAARLPEYMLPSAVVVIDEIPLTANGKVDRAALPTDYVVVAGRAPRTPQEEVLCGLFGEVLGRQGVGIDDGFFDLGGHSLLIPRLLSRIRSVLGVELPVRALFEADTVAELTRWLADGGRHDAWDVLLPLRRGGEHPPLFCIHPVIGLSWTYAGLLRHLSTDIPVYGVQSRGMTNPAELPRSVAEMVEDYVSLISQVQPEGPCYLLGWSFGGTIAQAVAAELQRRRGQVALLVLLDASPAPKLGDVELPVPDRSGLYRQMLEAFGVDLPTDQEPLDYDEFLRAARAKNSVLAHLADSQIDVLMEVVRNNRDIVRKFEHDPVDVDTLLFAANDGSTELSSLDAWDGCINGAIEIHHVPCDHIHMTSLKALEIIGPIIERKLQQLR